MSIEQSLNRLAKIKAELNKPSAADAEGLKPFKVTKRIALSYGKHEEDEVLYQDKVIWAKDEESAQAEFVEQTRPIIVEWDVREITPTGGDE